MSAQSSTTIEYNPLTTNQQSLVHDPFNAAANINEEFIDVPLLMPPNKSSASETPSKKLKKNSGKTIASTKQVIIC